MSLNAIEIKEGQVVTSFASFSAAPQFCTPTILGCKACITASISGGIVVLTVTLSSPIGTWTQSFSFNTNKCFTFQPNPRVKLELCISNFTASKNQICFTVGGKVCLKVPFLGWKCTPSFSRQFCLPIPGIKSKENLDIDSIDDLTFMNLLLLSSKFEDAEDKNCNCH